MATRQDIIDQINIATKGYVSFLFPLFTPPPSRKRSPSWRFRGYIELNECTQYRFDCLLNNDIKAAESILSANGDAFSKLGLGTARFLAAAMSREDDELQRAVETLTEAEAMASAEVSRKRSPETSVYPLEICYKLLVADATIAQALIAIMSESYSGFISGLYKMNKAHKGFSQVEKAVFPNGFDGSESLDTIFTRLNDNYIAQTTNPRPQLASTPSFGSSFLPWRRRKELPRHNSSPSLTTLKPPEASPSLSTPASRDNSRAGSADGSVEDLAANLSMNGSVSTTASLHPKPLWEDDPITTMIIGGASLGAGLFGLIMR